IVDSSGRPVSNAANIPFSQIPPISQPQQTYPFVAEWTYPSNLSEGNYQVWIDIVDIQGNVAYNLHGPFGFGLFKPGLHAIDLIPYVVGAAGGITAGALYVKRRLGLLIPTLWKPVNHPKKNSTSLLVETLRLLASRSRLQYPVPGKV